jgi:hypothetical protein
MEYSSTSSVTTISVFVSAAPISGVSSTNATRGSSSTSRSDCDRWPVPEPPPLDAT